MQDDLVATDQKAGGSKASKACQKRTSQYLDITRSAGFFYRCIRDYTKVYYALSVLHQSCLYRPSRVLINDRSVVFNFSESSLLVSLRRSD